MIGIFIWLVIGGVVGWLAGLIMRDNNGIVVNVIVGVIGAFVGGLIVNGGSINDAPLSIVSFGVSLLGAIILLAIVNLVRRGSAR